MKYQVIWVTVAEHDLAAIWLDAPDRKAVTSAVQVLDVKLRRDRLHLGESRKSSFHRVAFEHPLGIEFEVIEDDKKVIVQGVWRAT